MLDQRLAGATTGEIVQPCRGSPSSVADITARQQANAAVIREWLDYAP